MKPTTRGKAYCWVRQQRGRAFAMLLDFAMAPLWAEAPHAWKSLEINCLLPRT